MNGSETEISTKDNQLTSSLRPRPLLPFLRRLAWLNAEQGKEANRRLTGRRIVKHAAQLVP